MPKQKTDRSGGRNCVGAVMTAPCIRGAMSVKLNAEEAEIVEE